MSFKKKSNDGSSSNDFNSETYELLYSKNILMLDREITEQIASDLIGRIILINLLTPKTKKSNIILMINSFGGDSYCGLGLVDAIKASEVPVTTICIGVAASCAAMILASGTKRLSLPNASIMIHPHWFETERAYTHQELMTEANESKRLHELNTNFWNEIISTSKGKVTNLMSKDSWLNPQQALSLNIIDEIVTSTNALPKTA